MPYDKHKEHLLNNVFAVKNSRTIGQGIRNHALLYSDKEKKPHIIYPKVDKKPEKPPDEEIKLCVKNIETLQPYHDQPLPFTLFIKPHEIMGHKPTEVQPPYVSQVQATSKEMRMNRPRVVLSPAMAIDVITDDEIYALVVSETYQSDKMIMDSSLEKKANIIKAPLAQTYTGPNPISLPKLKPKVVPPEWRLDSISWDKTNLRGHCEVNKEFWLKFRQ